MRYCSGATARTHALVRPMQHSHDEFFRISVLHDASPYLFCGFVRRAVGLAYTGLRTRPIQYQHHAQYRAGASRLSKKLLKTGNH